jgi:small conductance mechanosensitive channel
MDRLIEAVEQFVNTNIVPYSWNLLMALVIFVVGKWLVTRLCNLLERKMSARVDGTISRFIARLAYVALLIFVVIAALEQLGLQTTSLIAIFGAAGLAVGLALKDSLGNFASGVMLILFRPFREQDYVEAAGTSGTVQEIRIFATCLITPDNKLITVPNGAIMADNITNYSAMPTRRVDMVFGVAYNSDLQRVRQVLQELLDQDERVLAEPAPVIVVGELGDSAINFWVRPWTRTEDYWSFKWDYTERVKQRFDEEGITIPFPQMDVHLEQLNAR